MLKLNNTIYSSNSVKHAIKDYKEIAVIEMKEDTGYFLIEFKNCLYDEKQTEKEFLNYVIDMMNQKGNV